MDKFLVLALEDRKGHKFKNEKLQNEKYDGLLIQKSVS